MQPRSLLYLFFLVWLLQVSSVAECQDSQIESKWYHKLTPRLTRSQLHKLAGKPDSTDKTTDIYRLPEGELKLEFQDGTLRNCDLKSSSGAVNNYFYTWGGKLEPEHLAARRKYLTARSFDVLPQFSGPAFYSAGLYGKSYQVDDDYLVIMPMLSLPCFKSHFKDKVARVALLHSDGTEEVLYCAFDHWQKLKPPQLSDAQVRQRMQKLHSLGRGAVGRPVYSVFGTPDATMGSGRCYRVFYLGNALAFVLTESQSPAERRKSRERGLTDKYVRQTLLGEAANQSVETIREIDLLRPGKEYVSMIQWLRETQPADWKPLDKTDGQ